MPDLTHDSLVALLERFECSQCMCPRCSLWPKSARCELCERRVELLAALRSGDFVLCPREPTAEMMAAARHDWHHGHGPQSHTLYGEQIVGIYRAMLNAAKGTP